MNIEATLIARIEDYRKSNKNPCKNYATKEAAEAAVTKAAINCANAFTKQGVMPVMARYLVIFVPAWGRWVGCIDMGELLRRDSSTGGYLGIEPGFYKF